MGARDVDEWQMALDEADADLRERERRALEADPAPEELRALAAERDKLATDRDSLADARDELARGRDADGLDRDVRGSRRDRLSREVAFDLDPGAVDRFAAGADRDLAAGDRADSGDDRRRAAAARKAAAEDRQRASDDRDAAASSADIAAEELDRLRRALETRVLIGRAEGLLMARHGVTADAAFRLLAQLSQESHVTLRDVATRIVADADGS